MDCKNEEEITLMVDMISFPSSFFSVKKVDEDRQQEYNAACAVGLFDIILFGYEQWFNKETLVLNKKTDNPVDAHIPDLPCFVILCECL